MVNIDDHNHNDNDYNDNNDDSENDDNGNNSDFYNNENNIPYNIPNQNKITSNRFKEQSINMNPNNTSANNNLGMGMTSGMSNKSNYYDKKDQPQPWIID